jgi:hypothetical protein
MEAMRVETTVQLNGRVILENLPFDEGDKVEIIILEAKEEAPHHDNPYLLRGTSYKYDDPFSPLISLDNF